MILVPSFLLLLQTMCNFCIYSPQITTRSRNTLFLNLLYRSIKSDPLHNRAMAFMKRLLMCATQSVPAIAAGLLFLISEIVKARPSLKSCLADTPEAAHAHAGSVDKDGEVGFLGNFNVLKREPEYAYAEDAQPSVWEMSLLKHHFHPSVQSFAEALLEPPEHRIEFGGDPTVEFSLMAFLNRFAYKNPKKNTTDRIKHRTAQNASEEPINLAFATQSSASVDPDKQFFHKYFSGRQQLVAEGRSRNRSKQRTEEDSEGSDDGDSDDDDHADGDMRGADDDSVEDDAEAEMDRYADKLAQDLMRNGNSNIDNDDFEFSDEDDSDDGSAVMGVEDEEGASDDDSEEGREFDQGLSEPDSEDEAPVKKSSKSKSNKALDFADFLVDQQGAQKGAKKDAKKASKTSKDADDSSDDGYTGLVAYGDDNNEVDAWEAEDGSDVDVDDASENASDDGSDDMDADSADDSDGFSDEEALDDVALLDSDAEDANISRTKSASKGAAKASKVDKFKEPAPTASKKGQKAPGSKSRKGESAFASAEDYEDIMDEIVKAVSLPAPAAPAAPAVAAGKTNNAVAAAPAASKPASKDSKKATEAAQAGQKRKGGAGAALGDSAKVKGGSNGAGKKKAKSS